MAAERLEAVLTLCLVGAAAGLVSAHVRLHLGLPGHKALVLLAPVVAARFASRASVGAMAGMAAAAAASLAMSAGVVGAGPQLLFFVLGGAVIDAAASFADRRGLATAWAVAVGGLAGLSANMVLLLGRLTGPVFQWHVLPGLSAMGTRAVSYALFGMIAGAAGAAAGRWIRRPFGRVG